MLSRRVTLGFFCSLLVACGGGGGGGGESSKSGGEGVRLLIASLDLPPSELLIDGPESKGTGIVSSFGASSGYRGIGQELISVSLQRFDHVGAVFASSRLEASASRHRTIIALGNRTSLGIRLAELDDDTAAPAEGSAKLRVVHGVDGAAQLNTTVGNVQLPPLAFGASTEFLELPAGPTPIALSRTNDGAPIASRIIEVEAGKSYTLVGIGKLGYVSSAVLLD